MQAQLAVDISVDSPAHAGIASTRFTQFLCQELRALRPLVLLLKQLLASRGLGSGPSGGLGSYALVLMATSLLQQQASLGGEALRTGDALHRFLELFGRSPEPHELIAVMLDADSRLQPKRVARAELGDGAAPLLVQDPLDLHNNVGSGCFNFHSVQRLFRDALAELQRCGDTGDGDLLASVLRFIGDEGAMEQLAAEDETRRPAGVAAETS